MKKRIDKSGVTIHITYARIAKDELLKDAVVRVLELLGQSAADTGGGDPS